MIETGKVRLGLGGSYSGNVEVWTDGTALHFKDASGSKTLAELAAGGVAAVGDLAGLGTDFATQYFNAARLAAYLGDPSNSNAMAVSGDVGANATLGAHIADASIHGGNSVGDLTGLGTDFATQYFNAGRLATYLGDAAHGNAVAISGDVGANTTLGDHIADSTIHGGYDVTDLTGLETDFATQYFNAARLATYLGDASHGNAVAISGDVGSNVTLGAHIADESIHVGDGLIESLLGMGTAGQVLATNAAEDGTEWVKGPPKISVSETEPILPADGDVWIDMGGEVSVVKVRDGSGWI